MMKTKGYLFFGLLLAALLLGGGAVLAQNGDEVSGALISGFDLSWWTVDGGGGPVSGGGYTLVCTAGQPDAGSSLAGGGYTLTGGFWAGQPTVTAPGHTMYFPVISKRH